MYKFVIKYVKSHINYRVNQETIKYTLMRLDEIRRYVDVYLDL